MSPPPPASLQRDRFEQLYRETRLAILGYLVRRAGNPSDAADLLAETFSVAWRRIDVVPEGDGARLWLYGVARRVLANHRRHERAERTLASMLEAELSRQLPQPSAPGRSALDATIADCLDSLGTTDREIIELSAWEQLTPAEIGTVLGRSAGAVRVRLHRIRRRLRADLLRVGYGEVPPPLPVGSLRESSL